jgi:hypothetical protein
MYPVSSRLIVFNDVTLTALKKNLYNSIDFTLTTVIWVWLHKISSSDYARDNSHKQGGGNAMELVIYGLALGVSAVIIVPILYSLVGGLLPTTLTTGVQIPTAVPTTAQAIAVSVVLWGIFLGLALWAVSMIHPVKTAIQNEA